MYKSTHIFSIDSLQAERTESEEQVTFIEADIGDWVSFFLYSNTLQSPNTRKSIQLMQTFQVVGVE